MRISPLDICTWPAEKDAIAEQNVIAIHIRGFPCFDFIQSLSLSFGLADYTPDADESSARQCSVPSTFSSLRLAVAWASRSYAERVFDRSRESLPRVRRSAAGSPIR